MQSLLHSLFWSLFHHFLGLASHNLAEIKRDRLGNASAGVPFGPQHALLLPGRPPHPGPALMRCDKANGSAFPRDWPHPQGKLPGNER